MSDKIKHECGVAIVRLLKPLEYYQLKYGTWMYGLNKLYLLMEKQHNRGQDGAGLACINFDLPPGKKYLHRQRSCDDSSIDQVFKKVNSNFKKIKRRKPELLNDAAWCKQNLPFVGELYLGHLRYGTFGKNKLETVHPVWRQNNWKSRNLVMAGNFTLTNVDDLFGILIDLGQHPKDFNDTVTVLENVGHFLDMENQRLFDKFKKEGVENRGISALISEKLDIARILKDSSKKWDGGYIIAGLIGHGDAFVYRDPWGIRPGYYYHDEEVAVVASERPAIQTVMDLEAEDIREIDPGHAVIIRKNGTISMEKVRKPFERRSCSFERIYFSRGGDQDIYRERKMLGELLTPVILKAIDHDIPNTVFSFIPNTAESAFYGMLKGIEDVLVREKMTKIKQSRGDIPEEKLREIITLRPRVEKIAIKDIKLRTFIAQDKGRGDLVAHIYDITYGTIRKGIDNMVIIDDSIVRGTTLRESILKILDRLGPRQIVVVSSCPQIRYPDCYGIDMAKLSDFIAFRAAIALLREQKMESVINDVYKQCLEEQKKPREKTVNVVKQIYKPFTADQISRKIGELLKSGNLNAQVKIVYQSIENLHKACPDHRGDWYFTGNYPTPGGNKVAVTSFINFIEGKDIRAY